MKRILILNAGNSDNLGDKAIRFNIEKILRNKGHEAYFLDISNPVEINMEPKIKRDKDVAENNNLNSLLIRLKVGSVKLMPRFLKWFWFSGIPLLKQFDSIKKNNSVDMIIIGGGQLLYSSKHFQDFTYGLLMWTILFKYIYKKPITMFSVGSVDKYARFAKLIYSFVLKSCNNIYVRDYHSMDILKKQFNINSNYVPDVVFSYSDVFTDKNSQKENIALIGIYGYESYKKFKGQSLSKDEYYNEWVKHMLYLKNEGYKIKLFYTTLEDKEETINFSRYLNKNNILNEFEVAFTDNLQTLIMELKKSKVVCSARMHALILGVNYECETIPFVISEKLKSFKDQYIEEELKLDSIREKIYHTVDEILNKSSVHN